MAKTEWLRKQSNEKYSVAVGDIAEAQKRAREGRPPKRAGGEKQERYIDGTPKPERGNWQHEQ